MIETKNISKSFDDIKAVDTISIQIQEGAVFGLIGTNGAGKSTFLRILAGIYKADEGEVWIDGESVYENVDSKKKFFYISDEQFFFQSATPLDMMKYYAGLYESFDCDRCLQLLESFELDKKRKIATFSKGMKKQLSILYGICANTKYVLLDETFDGLDPVMRQGIKKLFASEMETRDFTPIIASHNLRELEDICDHVGLLHKGGVILSQDLADMKDNIHKIQFVLKDAKDVSVLDSMQVLTHEERGSLHTLVARGNREEILEKIRELDPIFIEALPLSLEEMFISETGGVGYDIKKLIF